MHKIKHCISTLGPPYTGRLAFEVKRLEVESFISLLDFCVLFKLCDASKTRPAHRWIFFPSCVFQLVGFKIYLTFIFIDFVFFSIMIFIACIDYLFVIKNLVIVTSGKYITINRKQTCQMDEQVHHWQIQGAWESRTASITYLFQQVFNWNFIQSHGGTI